jgi:uncharacterized delta-60 repeat protein
MTTSVRRSLAVWLLVSLAGLLVHAAAQIGGLDPGFAPGAILNGAAAGVVRALIVQSDGKVIIAGDFTLIGGTARGRLARLNTDGSLDASFASAAGADGPINALAVQTDGKIIIGGEFTTFDGTARNRVARVTTTGVLDTTFTPGTGANGTVNAVLIVSSSIYIGGDFTQVNGSARVRLARLTSTGTLDSFMSGSTGANATVYALAYYSFGSNLLYVGGAFTTFNGQSRNRLAAVSSSSGSLDSFFNSTGGPDGTVYTMAINTNVVGSSTQLFIGGDFTNIGATARGHIASLTASIFSSQSPAVDPGFSVFLDGRVRCLALQSGGSAGRLIVGGDFTQVEGQPRNRITRINSSTSGNGPSGAVFWDFDTTFNSPSGANATVRALGVTSDSKTVLGGEFSSIAGTTTQSVARLYSDAGSQPPATPGGLAATAVSSSQIIVSFNSTPFATSYKIERSPDGANDWMQIALQSATMLTDSALAPGTQYFYRVTARNSNGDSAPSASVNATTAATEWTGAGALDPASSAGTGVNGTINSIVYQPDGAMLVAGSFTNLQGLARKNIARLLPDWTVDPAFDPGVGPDGAVSEIALQPDGKVVIVGSFINFAGTARKYVARLEANGALDTSFVNSGAGPSSSVSHVALQPDGSVLITGSFSTVNGSSHPYVARFMANGTLDSSFVAAPSNSVDAISVQRDGRILLGGFFFEVNGFDVGYLVRLLPDGEIDPSFNIGSIGAFIESVVALKNGKVLVGGWFDTVNGLTRHRVVRLNADGSLDSTFDPGTGPDSIVYHVVPQPDGKVIITGSFTKVAGVVRPHIARLNADGTLDTTFQPGAGTFSTINAVAVGSETRIVIGGDFTSFGTGARNRIARLLGDGCFAPPPMPSGLSVAPASSSSLLVSWTDLPAEQGWKPERSPDGLSGWVPLPEVEWDVTAFTDSGLTANTGYFYRLRSSNCAGDSDYTAAVSGRTLSLYEQWKVNNGYLAGARDNSDADGDGLSLIAEYGLGLDPAVPASDGLPVCQVIGDVVAFSYRKFRSDVNYAVEASNDLQTWSANGVNQGTGSFPIAWKPINGTPQVFLRLRISLP